MGPQRGARLSGRITVPGKCEVLSSLMPSDTQTDGCEQLCFKTVRSRNDVVCLAALSTSMIRQMAKGFLKSHTGINAVKFLATSRSTGV